jgi:hypothetical protein
MRQLVSVNGRVPRPRDQPECTDPPAISPDSLSMLLRHNREKHEFTFAGAAREDRRDSLMIDYRSISRGTPEVVAENTCIRVELPGWSRGRIWIDAASYEVLRLDESLNTMFDFPTPRDLVRRVGAPSNMVLERHDVSIRYREIKFEDPEEILMLPRRADSTTVWRNTGSPRVRITQEFSDYRRFLTGGRIVDRDELR